MRLVRFPDKKLSNKSAQAGLTSLLVSCTDKMLLSFTPDYLARCYSGTKLDAAARMLADEKRRRGL